MQAVPTQQVSSFAMHDQPPEPWQHTLYFPQHVCPEPPGHFVQFCAPARRSSSASRRFLMLGRGREERTARGRRLLALSRLLAGKKARTEWRPRS